MGKRKSTRKPQKARRNEPLPSVFTCPFCNHEKAVSCKIERDRKVATVSCRMCEAKYQVSANELTQPIDAYSEWIDACEKADKEKSNGATVVRRVREAEDDEDNDDIAL